MILTLAQAVPNRNDDFLSSSFGSEDTELFIEEKDLRKKKENEVARMT